MPRIRRIKSVFLNIPYDAGFENLYLAYIVGLTQLGLGISAALAVPNQGRLGTIIELIEKSELSIHDLSRVEVSRGVPRFNMPVELGLALYRAHITNGKHRVFIFERKQYRAQRSTSDVNGLDPQIHHGTVQGLMSGLRNIFRQAGDVTTVPEMLDSYRAVKQKLPELRRNAGSKSLFEAAIFKDLTLAALVESQKLIARRKTRMAPGADPRLSGRYHGRSLLMQRRDFLRFAGLAAASSPLIAQQPQSFLAPSGPQDIAKTDFTLEIAPITVELAPNRILSTIGYNGTSPGPLLRMKEGVPVTVNVVNNTDVPEFVHFHGLQIPSDVDGAEEEGTPPVPPHGSRRYQFTPTPAGTRWYHTHTMSMEDLHRGSYTGMFGFLVIEGANNPGRFDQEHYLALRDWEPYFSNQLMDTDDLDPTLPQPERPAVLDTRPVGPEVAADIFSINDKALGAGEPIRVNSGERVMFHFLNASAIENRHLALPGHKFNVIGLDGNPVPTPGAVDVLMLGPGERIDAWVEMNQPGVWILGAPEDPVREGGLGIVIEYANQHRTPRWTAPPKASWDYTVFGKPAAPPAPAEKLDMIFEKVPRGSGKFNTFTVNGKSYPHEQEFLLKKGARYRLTFHNRTDDAHPLHLHRHQFEIAEIYGKPTSGLIKDTVVVPTYGRASVDFTADQPGPTLFHCHIQQHMDFGFKALLRYA